MARRVEAAGKLLRIFGVVFGVAAVVGGMVGQGILRTPGIVAGAVYSWELIIALWLGGAVLVAVSAFAYVELGSAIPRAGGPYDYVRRTFGSLAGVVTGWAAWLVLVTVAAFLSIVVAEFLHRLGILQEVSPSILAVAVLIIFWAVNWTGTRIAGDSQIGFSALKGAALVGLVVLLFAQPGVGTSAPQAPSTLGGTVGIAAVAIAMRAIINTYDGWQDVVYFSEEMEDPGRTLPRSMAWGVGTVVVLYLLVNFALLHVLSPAEMAASELPAADAARLALGPSGEVALTIFAVVSVAAITNVTIMKTARIAYSLARAGQLPEQLSKVSASGTPRTALTVSTLLAAVFAATGTYETVVAMNVAVGVAIVILVNVTAVFLRGKEPDLSRPFRIPLYPIPIVIAVAVNSALLAALIYEDPLHSLAGFAFLLGVAVVYLMLDRNRRAAPA